MATFVAIFLFRCIMELWDLYDSNRIKTGKTWARDSKDTFPKDLFRVVVHVAIFNSQGELLIQQRQDHKTYGGTWDLSAAGSIISGETSKQGAERETLEELGIKISLPNRPILTTTFTQGFDDYYLTKQDLDLKDLTLQPSEVKNAKWATLPQILQMLNSGEFMAYSPDFIKLLFFINEKGKLWNR